MILGKFNLTTNTCMRVSLNNEIISCVLCNITIAKYKCSSGLLSQFHLIHFNKSFVKTMNIKVEHSFALLHHGFNNRNKKRCL